MKLNDILRVCSYPVWVSDGEYCEQYETRDLAIDDWSHKEWTVVYVTTDANGEITIQVTDRPAWKYGMRNRGYSIGCQPKGDLLQVEEDKTWTYHNILVYTRELSEHELQDYELDFLGICSLPDADFVWDWHKCFKEAQHH